VGQVVHPGELGGGGFVSWQTQLLDDKGNGVILAWGHGGPEHPDAHVPGADAGQMPTLTLLIHAAGEPVFWLHQTYPPDQAPFAPARGWKMGPNRIELGGDGQTTLLIAHFDAPLPGTAQRLQGHVEMAGVPMPSPPVGAQAKAVVEPLFAFGRARAILDGGEGARFHLEGHAAGAQVVHRPTQAGPSGGRAGWVFAPFDQEIRFARYVQAGETGSPSWEGTRYSMDDARTSFSPLDRISEGESGNFRLEKRGEAGSVFLATENAKRLHASPSITRQHFQTRAPMRLPTFATGIDTSLTLLGDATSRRALRDILHHSDARASSRVRLGSGVLKKDWRQRVRLLLPGN
jgi:hypothetical protein